MNRIPRFLALPIGLCFASLFLAGGGGYASTPGEQPIHVFCGTGDHLCVRDREPVDSRAVVEAMVEWLHDTYRVRRIYWRGAQDQLWLQHVRVWEETPQYHDIWQWIRRVEETEKISESLVRAAHARGMEAFAYTGLFEAGVQPDVGIVSGSLFEDNFRRRHPEWCALDRWGRRRGPGWMCFAYPEVRREFVERYRKLLDEQSYDGIIFYTYVENLGLRYLDEFAYNEPILRLFREKHPDVDVRSSILTEEQRRFLYECRGKFVTQFLRELKEAIAPKDKKVSMILDSVNPDYAQPWWGKPLPGTGMIEMQWRRWVDEGVVDELWIQQAPTADQLKTLALVQDYCRGKPVKLTLRNPEPFHARWDPFVEKGLTPTACITWANNGIEKYSLAPTSVESLSSSDWKLRLQTLSDVELGRLKASPEQIAALPRDPHPLVRRKLIQALAATKAGAQASVVERLLADPETSVQIAAAAAIKAAHRENSASVLIAAIKARSSYQFDEAAIESLGTMGTTILPELRKALRSDCVPVRVAAIRALAKVGLGDHPLEVVPDLLPLVSDTKAEPRVRFWAVHVLGGLCGSLRDKDSEKAVEARARILQAFVVLLPDEPSNMVMLEAAQRLADMSAFLADEQRDQLLERAEALLLRYGDGCTRSDAQYGWRRVGNLIRTLGPAGDAFLEECLARRDNRWLAWIAYEVKHLAQKPNAGQFCLVDEARAIAEATKAPPFPGWTR